MLSGKFKCFLISVASVFPYCLNQIIETCSKLTQGLGSFSFFVIWLPPHDVIIAILELIGMEWNHSSWTILVLSKMPSWIAFSKLNLIFFEFFTPILIILDNLLKFYGDIYFNNFLLQLPCFFLWWIFIFIC